ncbi:hypothetical protein DMN91_002113 [Ooceraea biroi]|uniref:Integrase zinc-binding domain-containing protein n=1 Tax=Ooceraea biroi TaxID=2015173 RepID=A0A3L8DZP4_OOCBI|nr:uncharacterized protein LOC105284426 [Ooceraea biroi]RLU25950.1 hypothetical protein DMN91_002113 [Ooceraea biroi]
MTTDIEKMYCQLVAINQFVIGRALTESDCREIQVHGFCDASSVSYGAVLYIRSIGKRRNVSVRLLCAKSRVAPLKIVTIPRLELCGAVLLIRLFLEVNDVLNVPTVRATFWTDSTIVLHWINTSPHLLKTYVANRVAEIQGVADAGSWRHVKSEENPADALSRGQMPHAFLQNQLWLSGPPWLMNDEGGWPSRVTQTVDVPELRKNVCLATSNSNFDILTRYESYHKLLRVVAHCLRFMTKNKHTGPLRAEEIDEAEIHVLRILQSICFQEEIANLKHNGVPGKGKLANLNPFIDDKGLIRVSGRLRKSDLDFARKHPILLPNRHRVTDNIIREAHIRYYHAGIQTTLSVVRQRFWLLDGRNQVRKIVRNCTRCFRYNAIPVDYKMGDLPQSRVCQATPFASTGIDFCGPFYVKEKKHRNCGRVKVYVCVFVCMTVKALHLEVVSNLTTDGFLAAFYRSKRDASTYLLR